MTKKELIEVLVTKHGKDAEALKNLKVVELEAELAKAQAASQSNTQDSDPTDPDQTNIPGSEHQDNPPKDTAPTEPPPATPSKTTVSDPKGKTIKVKSLVNMINGDGVAMVVNKLCDLSEAEYNRLKKDARGPFFEE